MTKEDLALEKLFEDGRTEKITRNELKQAGFPTGIFSRLSSTGFDGKHYKLSKRISEETFTLVKK